MDHNPIGELEENPLRHPTQKRQRVVIAMSGGIDSSVAAAMLVDQGYDVIGLMLRLWSEPGAESTNRCCTPQSMARARQVAGILDIPFYVLDVRDLFFQSIVQSFIEGYANNITPNPCLTCNRLIRFGVLLDHTRTLDANFLATGHYARLQKSPHGQIKLLKAVDREKDQSYVLSVLNQEQLKQAIFPLGEWHKSAVRELAAKYGITIADQPESQDLCFLAGDDYRNFLVRNVPQLHQPGPITNARGDILGSHNGLAFYTIGQRKGLGVASPKPLYVMEKDGLNNTLVVGEHNELGKDSLEADRLNWIAGAAPRSPIQAQIQIRYRAPAVDGMVVPLKENRVLVELHQKVRDITPGQGVVFYDGESCLGGGIIT